MSKGKSTFVITIYKFPSLIYVLCILSSVYVLCDCGEAGGGDKFWVDPCSIFSGIKIWIDLSSLWVWHNSNVCVYQPKKYNLSLSLVFQVEELCRFLSQPSSAYSGVDYGRTAGHVVYMVLLIKYSTIWFIWCEGINTIWPAGIKLILIDWKGGLLLINSAFYSPLFFLKSYCW